jgi:hypothetical protein
VQEGFVGSPTIRIDGRDVVDPGGQAPALNCRVYHRRDGRVSPTPDPEDLHDALITALAAASHSPVSLSPAS